MSNREAIRMDEDERDAFLGTGGVGVIALSETGEESPHAVPVSYGYDETEDVFYFRLATDADADSEKGELSDRPVTFATYGKVEDEWRSVVARGRLRETTEESVALESLEGLERVDIPLVDIFDRPTSEVSFGFYRLDPEELTGRKESRTEV